MPVPRRGDFTAIATYDVGLTLAPTAMLRYGQSPYYDSEFQRV